MTGNVAGRCRTAVRSPARGAGVAAALALGVLLGGRPAPAQAPGVPSTPREEAATGEPYYNARWRRWPESQGPARAGPTWYRRDGTQAPRPLAPVPPAARPAPAFWLGARVEARGPWPGILRVQFLVRPEEMSGGAEPELPHRPPDTATPGLLPDWLLRLDAESAPRGWTRPPLLSPQDPELPAESAPAEPASGNSQQSLGEQTGSAPPAWDLGALRRFLSTWEVSPEVLAPAERLNEPCPPGACGAGDSLPGDGVPSLLRLPLPSRAPAGDEPSSR